jgi:hypothetical protein
MTLPLWLKRLGWPGLMGVLALMGVGWVEHTWMPQQNERVQQTESEGRRLRHELQAANAMKRIDPKASPREVWTVLWEGLPDASKRLTLQSDVLAAAKQAGIALSTVQMRGELVPWIDKSQPQGLWRQRMVMPMQASYPALRSWLSILLRQPALSIDSLDIQRTDPMSDQIKAQVTVSLWWRQDRGH